MATKIKNLSKEVCFVTGQKWPLKGKKQMTLAVIYYRLIRRRLKFLRMEHHVIGLLFLSFSLTKKEFHPYV